MARNGLGRVVRGLVGAGAIALVMVGQAAAVPLTGPLGFDQRAGFLSPAVSVKAGLNLVFVLPALGAGYPANTYKTITWEKLNEAGDPSKLVISTFTSANSPTKGKVAEGDTNGDGFWDSSEFWTISRLTQTNNVINESGVPLWTILARANLTLYFDSALTSPIGTQSDHDTKIEFNETINKTKASDCKQSSNPHGTLCDDFYRVPLADLVTPVSIPLGGGDFLDLTFKIFDPLLSIIILQEVGGDLLAFTREDAPGTSIVDLQMHWALRHTVPAPAGLLLVGVGMTAIAALRLRRKAS